MNWEPWYFRIFWGQLFRLMTEVQKIQDCSPDKLHGHPKLKLMLAVDKVISQATADPLSKTYKLGNALGKEHTDWRRAKDGLPERYRLFFKFFSRHQDIFFTWLNDEKTLRKDGAKTDCYAVFKRMLDSGIVPSDHAGLREHSESMPKKQ